MTWPGRRQRQDLLRARHPRTLVEAAAGGIARGARAPAPAHIPAAHHCPVHGAQAGAQAGQRHGGGGGAPERRRDADDAPSVDLEAQAQLLMGQLHSQRRRVRASQAMGTLDSLPSPPPSPPGATWDGGLAKIRLSVADIQPPTVTEPGAPDIQHHFISGDDRASEANSAGYSEDDSDHSPPPRPPQWRDQRRPWIIQVLRANSLAERRFTACPGQHRVDRR